MIGYRISLADLEAEIEKAVPGWLKRARWRTNKFRKAGAYSEKSTIWGEVKPVYMKLQGDCKCAFCERGLPPAAAGTLEPDVEHFRPKGNLAPWEPSPDTAQKLADRGMAVTPPAGGAGYHLLPYHPFNYTVACKTCNTTLKAQYFPITGAYCCAGDDPAALLAEKPLLIYPLGDFDRNPEELIDFYGVSPRAVAADDYGKVRGLVTIEFFQLDHPEKSKHLIRERRILIMALYPQLEKLAADPANAEVRGCVDDFIKPGAPHANCMRSLKHLFDADPAEAKAVFEKVCAGFPGRSP